MATWTQQFDAYPHWLVWASLGLTTVAAFWLIGSVMKGVLKLALTLALLAVVGGIIIWALA